MTTPPARDATIPRHVLLRPLYAAEWIVVGACFLIDLTWAATRRLSS
jgi:hypothetical protein